MSKLFRSLTNKLNIRKYFNITTPKRKLNKNVSSSTSNSNSRPNLNPFPSNMNFRTCESTNAARTSDRRPLLLLFAWMAAKDRHLEKYRQLWFERGFDVLTVRTSLIDFIAPDYGGRKNSKKLFNVLSKLRHQYPEMIFHSLSVGNFHSFDFIYRTMEFIKQNNAQKEDAQQILDSVKGLVVDSIAFPKDFSHGLGLTYSPNNQIGQLLISCTIGAYLNLTKFALKRFHQLEQHFRDNIDKPTLCLFSETDVISDANGIRDVIDKWKQNGALLQVKCWDKSAHVMHYYEHPVEYAAEIDAFLSKLKLNI